MQYVHTPVNMLTSWRRYEGLIVFLIAGVKSCGLSEVQNSFNFSCDLTPAQHDNILQKAVEMLQKGGYTNTP